MSGPTPFPPLDDGHLASRIASASLTREAPVRAETFVQIRHSASRPAYFSCSDGRVYVVKGKNAGRQAVNDQIVGRLGVSLNCPVGVPAFVEVQQALVDASPDLRVLPNGGFGAGVWHGSRHLGNVSDDREGFAFQSAPENRERFAQLAILYGLAYVAGDHQFLYGKAPPRLVFSHDHGHFFPGGPDWTVQGLESSRTPATPDQTIVSACSLTTDELRRAGSALVGIDAADVIVTAVAAPHDAWGISMGEKVAMAKYLLHRFDELLDALAALPR